MNVNIYRIRSTDNEQLMPDLINHIGKCSAYIAYHNKVYVITPSEFPMEEKSVLFYEVTRRPRAFFIQLLVENFDFDQCKKYSVEKRKFFLISPSFYDYVKKSTNIGDKNIICNMVNVVFEITILD